MWGERTQTGEKLEEKREQRIFFYFSFSTLFSLPRIDKCKLKYENWTDDLLFDPLVERAL